MRIINKPNHRGRRVHSAAEPQLKTLTTEGTEITEKLVKNLTTEIAEHTEIKTANGTRPRAQGKNGPLPTASRKAKSPKGLSERDLCDHCSLFVHLFVLIPGGSKGKEESIFIK
jgi:hypothetical protein